MVKIKYLGDESTGVPFEEGETLTIAVTDELIVPDEGFINDAMTYTATLLDVEHSEKINAGLLVDLYFGAVKVVNQQALSAGVYSQTTGLLTLVTAVPAAQVLGPNTVQLRWVDQIFTV
jgi:hypothetical protein